MANSKFHAVTVAEFKDADDELNVVYKRVTERAYDSKNKNLLKLAQRKWNKLKQQWGVVYAAHYKTKNKKDAVRLGHYLLTQKRIESLNQHLNEN